MVEGDVAEEHDDLHVALRATAGEDAAYVVAGPEVAGHLLLGHLLGVPQVALVRLLNEVEGALADHHLVVGITQEHGENSKYEK